MSLSLFDNPDFSNFFNPLCCKNRIIYFECIDQLIEKSKQVSVLYEEDARDTLILYFRNLKYAVVEESVSSADESISSNKTEPENAGAILKYFRHCGWLSEREVGRNGDNTAEINPYCIKVIDSIKRIFGHNDSAALSNHIFAIYDILKSASTDSARTARPYRNVLTPVKDNIYDLKNELVSLRNSISTIMRMISKMTETNQLGQFFVKDEMMKTFFNDYFFIKKDGLIPGYISEIEKMLRKIEKTEIFKRMIAEYGEMYDVDESEAKEAVTNQYASAKEFISYDYVREMDYIEQKINNYYNLYSTRLQMVVMQNSNIQSYISDVLDMLKVLDDNDKTVFLEKIQECFALQSYKYVGPKSLERRKKKNPNKNSAAIVKSELSAEERERWTDEIKEQQNSQYGFKKTKEYFDDITKNKKLYIPSNEDIVSKRDVLMIASCFVLSESNHFPYNVDIQDSMVETDIADMSKFVIRREEDDG